MSVKTTNEDRLLMIRECWMTFGDIHFPMLTSKELSEIEYFLITLQELYED
jgi:hypothetical protein